jgi:uncharacterized protein DUF3597
MSIFSSILGKIFHPAQAAQPSAAQPAPQATAPASAPAAPTATATGTAAPAAPAQPVDVEAVLNGMAAKHPEKLNWRTSIVDLLKLLDLDSSLDARKQLAQELGYTNSTADSAAMNVWLHKQVMQKLADNGGKVPAELKD